MIVLLLILTLSLTACASTESSDPQETGHTKTSYEAPVVSEKTEEGETNQTADAIKLPSASKPKSYFAKINDDIVKGVENGSPASINEAMS